MSDVRTVQELNRELARKINEEALKDPHSPYANKFVGLANGQVAVVGDDLDDVIRRLRQVDIDPSKLFFLEASRDDKEVEYIWGFG